MFLLFHDIGMPVWGIFLFLFGIFVSPVWVIAGIYYLVRKEYEKSTFILFSTAVLLLSLSYLVFRISLISMDFFAYVTAPFGSATAFLLSVAGIPLTIVYGIGASVNFSAVFGPVRFIEKRF